MAKSISLQQIKTLRDQSGAGIMEAKKALTESKGDLKKAIVLLQQWGAEKVAKREDKAATAGRVYAYIHPGSQVGAMVAVLSETDFVANSREFESLCRELCLQIASMAPKDLTHLLKQPYVRDAKRTVSDLVTEYSVKFKEKVIIRAFERFSIG